MLSEGDRVRIIAPKNPFYGRTGIIRKTMLIGEVPHVRLYLEGFKALVVSKASNVESLEVTNISDPDALVENMHKRFLWVRLNTMSDVLDLLKYTTSVDEARGTLIEYIHSHSERCLKHPLEALKMTGSKSTLRWNELVSLCRDNRKLGVHSGEK